VALSGILVSGAPNCFAQSEPAESSPVEDTRPASELSIELEWNAPRECQRRQSVLDEAARLIPREVIPKTMRAQANVTTDSDGRWQVTLTFRGGVQGQRRLQAVSCKSLVEAVSVIIALAATGESVAEEPPPAEPEPEPEPRPVVVVDPGPPPAEPAVSARGISIGLGAALEDGIAPLAAQGRLGVGWFAPLGIVALELGGGPFGTTTLEDPEAQADFNLFWLGARGCLRLAGEALRLDACAMYRLQRLSAEASGPEVAKVEESVTLYTPGAGLRLGVPLGDWFAVEAGVDAFVPLSRPAFVVETRTSEGAVSRDSIHRPKTIVPSGYLGLVIIPARF
jgi:hypothetical protein